MQFRVLVLSMLAAMAAAQETPFRWPGGAAAAVVLTYDDGIDAHLDHAMPDLEAAGLRGTFYVPGHSASLRRRVEEWRAAARRGHELGNHTLFHPCLRHPPEGKERAWVAPGRELGGYTVERMMGELEVMNTLLHAVDGGSSRTLAYTCGDETAGGVSFVDPARKLFTAARAYRDGFKGLADPRKLDPHRVPSWALSGESGAEMIAWAEEAVRSGGLAVFTFHGVGGGHGIDVPREAHRQLTAWLGANRARVWTAPFQAVMAHVLAARAGADAQPAPEETVVWRAGEDGYHTYRIPAAVATNAGTLLAFCEGRRQGRGDAGDIDLLVKRSRDGGRTWSKAITVADMESDTIGNPAPVVDRRTGTVWLLLTSNPGNVAEKDIAPGISGPTRRVWVTHSRDDGATWAPPTEITAAVKAPEWSWYATGPVNGIQLRSGRMVIPCDHDAGSSAKRYSHAIYSDDGGRTWKRGAAVGPQTNESTVAELPDGSLMLNMRSYHGRNRRAVSISRDGGETWSEPVLDEALVEPVCQGSLLGAGEGREAVLLFANPADRRRRNMTVRLSRDGGRTWPASRTIYAGPAAYSNLVDLGKGWIGLLYEGGAEQPYETIRLARFRIDSLR